MVIGGVRLYLSGGFGGGEMFPFGGGDLLGRGINTAPGTGEVSAAQEGATILGSALVSSVASRCSELGLGPVPRGGGIGYNLDPPPPREGGVLSPISFQPGDIGGGFTSVSLGRISLKGMPAERPRGGGRPLKTYLLLKFDSPALLATLRGSDQGRRALLRPTGQGVYLQKAWEAGSMEPGMYIMDGAAIKGLLGTLSPSEGRDPFDDRKGCPGGRQTNNGGLDNHLPLPARGGDQGGQGGVGGLKTLRGRGNTDLLNSPK